MSTAKSRPATTSTKASGWWQVARETKRMMQIGSQHRSTPFKMRAMEAMQGGLIGNVYLAKGLCYKRRASIGHQADSPTPPGVDWDLFLGRRRCARSTSCASSYNWHWFWDTGNGDIGNQGVHEMGIAGGDWAIRSGPKTAYAQGGKYALQRRSGNAQHAAGELRLRRRRRLSSKCAGC